MPDDDDLDPRERRQLETPNLVDCDDMNCRAVRTPTSPSEYRHAYNHWRYHSYLYGCSHAR